MSKAALEYTLHNIQSQTNYSKAELYCSNVPLSWLYVRFLTQN